MAIWKLAKPSTTPRGAKRKKGRGSASASSNRSSAASFTTTYPATAQIGLPPCSSPQSWAGEPHNAEPDKHEGLFWVSMEKPSPDCHPYTTAIFHMITHGPSYRALNWPTQGGSE
ncbi:hypothetical protein ACFT7S_06495 [Streptomyces sp. NPDC057136]|uniref:hypothetical protein n=1 Tax=Streptomyces sp. NPDC057136 TaxID=3346029 RepID=UPI0036389E06